MEKQMVNEENILMKALYDMDFKRIKSILKQGFDVNEPYNKHGWTPFMRACKEFYEPDIIKAFIQAGGDVKSRNRNGETPFMIAAVKRSSPQTLAVLLEAGADINARDKFGNTSFIYVVRHPQALMRIRILDFMIDNGANADIKNNRGLSVWDYAAEQEGMTEYLCVRLLEESEHE
jgi:putative ankyrin repeat protein L93